MFLPLVTQKEGVFVSGQKRPGFARAVNGDKLDSFSNLEVSSSVWLALFFISIFTHQLRMITHPLQALQFK